MSTANERQIAGDHYKKHGQYQPWDVLQSWLTPEEYRGWQKGVAIVYLARERDKGGDQDIMKAGHHIEKLVEVMAHQAAAQKATDAEAALNKGVVPHQAAAQKATDAEAALNKGVVPLEQALASGAVPDSFFEQLSVETASMGRDEALEYTNNALDERESLRQLGLAEVKTFENPTANAVRKLDHSAWTAVLDTGNDAMSLARPRTTTFLDKVKLLSPEGRATYSVDIAECLTDMVFLKKRLTDIDRDEANRFTQSIRRVDGAIALLNSLAPLFAEPAE